LTSLGQVFSCLLPGGVKMRDPANEVGIVCSSRKYRAFSHRRGWNYQVGWDVCKTITLNKICRA